MTILPAIAVAMVSCGSGGPSTSGGYNPLDPAGGAGASTAIVDAGYKPGDFVKTSINDAAFFKNKPDGNADANKLLPGNTRMKVVAVDGSYLKVELDSGEVGYVPSMLVVDESNPGQTGSPVTGNEIQVYPWVTDPSNTVEANTPSIPPVIDPDLPDPEIIESAEPEMPPLPDDAPTPGLGSEPPLPTDVEESPEEPSEEEPSEDP